MSFATTDSETSGEATVRTGELRGILKVKTDKESLSMIYGQDASCEDPSSDREEDKEGEATKVKDLSVSMGELTILEFPITIGDNPSCYRGPSIAISWEPQYEITIPLSEFENNRPSRRCGRQMVMPPDMRFDMLRRAGFARKEIIEFTKPVNIARAQRKKTNATLGLSQIQELSEKVSRKTLNILSLGGRKRKERQLMKAFRRSSGEGQGISKSVDHLPTSPLCAV